MEKKKTLVYFVWPSATKEKAKPVLAKWSNLQCSTIWLGLTFCTCLRQFWWIRDIHSCKTLSTQNSSTCALLLLLIRPLDLLQPSLPTWQLITVINTFLFIFENSCNVLVFLALHQWQRKTHISPDISC